MCSKNLDNPTYGLFKKLGRYISPFCMTNLPFLMAIKEDLGVIYRSTIFAPTTSIRLQRINNLKRVTFKKYLWEA
jgi:hypothetical protein